METLYFGLSLLFGLLAIFIVARYTKPTTNNYYGGVHYHGQDGEEKPKSLANENVRQLVRDAGELHREFRGIEKGEKTSNDRTLPE
jgi:hypothetical protein